MKRLTVSVVVLVVAALSGWGQNQSTAASSNPSVQTAKTFAEGRRRGTRTISSSTALSRIFARVLPGYTFKRSKMKGCRVDRVSPDGFWTCHAEDSKTNEVAWTDFYERHPANFCEAINWVSSNYGTNVLGGCHNRVSFLRLAACVIEESCPDVSGAKEYCAKLRSQADELAQALRKSATVASAKQTSENRQTRKPNNGKGTETVDGITWQYELVNGVAVVGSVDGISQHAAANDAIGGNVRIPARLGGCEVGCIGPLAFAGCGRILTVDIPDSITNIGKLAFWDCRSLKKLVIPPHVTGFGDGVLAQCNALRSLTIPAGVTNFAEDNLSLANLREIHLDERNPVLKMNNGIFWNSRTGELILCFKDVKGDLILPQGVKRIKRWQFKDCKGLTSIEIPEGVTEIGEYAFWCCEGMKTVKLPKSLRSIAEGAFYHCVKLESVEIPDGISEIPYRAFEDCWKLKTVSLPSNVKSIGERAFAGCRGITFRSDKAGEHQHSLKFPAELLPKEDRIADFDFEGQSLSNKVNSTAAVSGIQMVAEDGCLNFDGRYQGRGEWPWDIVFPELDFDGFTLAMSFFPEESGLIFHSLGLMSAYIGSECSLCFRFQGKGKSLNSYVLTYPNEWNWFVLSIDARNKSVCMVVNGEYCGTSALSNNYAWPVAQSTPNEIARSLVFGSPGNGSRFKGKIDDVLVFNRPLSADEMQRIANGQPPLPQVKTGSKSDVKKASISDAADRSDAWTLRWARKNRSCFWNASISKGGVVLEAHCDGHEVCLQPLSYVAEKLDLSAPVVSPDGEKYVITGIGAKENFLQGYCSSQKTVLREVNLPETVTNLYDEAFKGSMLQEIRLPTNLVHVGKEAFCKCYGLTSITIPGNVKRVSSGAFSHCDNLKKVVLSEGVQDVDGYAFYSCRRLAEMVVPASVKQISYSAFQLCPRLVSVDIKGKDVTVDKTAFSGDTPVGAKMPDLSEPLGPISVVVERKVPTGRFKDEWTDARSCIRWFYTACNDLAQIDRIEVMNGFSGHVEVPEFIDGRYVEQNEKLFDLLERIPSLKGVALNPSNSNYIAVGGLVCDKEHGKVVLCPRGAKEITLPANVKDVSSIFDYSSDLQAIRVAPGNRHFISRDGVLYDKEMTTLIRCPNAAKNVVIPDSVRIISKRAFCGCKALSEVRIPDGVTEIQASAFSSCTGLCSVVLPKNLARISQNMFSDCTSLKSITLPQSVRKIDWRAFADCNSLQSVAVNCTEGACCADGQTMRVEDDAFLWCGNLTSIDLPGSDVRLFSKPFGGCTNLTELSFLPRMQVLWTGALEDTAYYRAISNGTPIVFHSRLMGIKEPSPAVLEIPFGVVEIAEAAFSGNKDLKSVVIPASVTNIERRAFSGCCQLETVTIPESVARIGYDSFSNCTNLKTVITATDDTNRVARIEQAFGREMKVSENGKLIVLPKLEKKKQGDAAKSRTTSRRQTSAERVWRDPKTGIDWRFSIYEEKASLGSAGSPEDRALVDVSYAGDLIIPERLDGYPVENVYHLAFAGCTNLTSIHVPKTVRQFLVEHSTLVSLTNVTFSTDTTWYSGRSKGRFLMSSVDSKKILDVCAGGTRRIDIPVGVECLSYGCLNNASWLEEVSIPSTVKKIEADAFAGCKGLFSRYDPDGKGYMVIDGWLIPTGSVRGRKFIVPAGVRHIASVRSGVSPWPDVYEVELTEGLETIGDEVFSGANIETVEFPKSLRQCDGFGEPKDHWGRPLKRMPLREGRGSLGRSSDMKRPLRNVIFNSGDVTFSLPDSVRRVTFAAGVTDIGVDCEGLRRPGLSSGLSGGSGVTTVVLPAGLRSIRTLPSFPELTEITIPSSVTNIGKSVFQKCEKLKTVGVEKNGAVERIPIDEFRRQWNIFFPDGNLHLTDAKTRINWLCKPSGRLSLLSDAAQAINGIRIVGAEEGDASSTLAIPETLAGLTVDDVDWGKLKFPSVVELQIPRTLKSFRFRSTSNESNIPRGMKIFSCGSAEKAMPNLQSVVVEDGNETYCSSDGVLCDAKTVAVLHCPRAREGRVTIAEGIKRVARGAFEGCTNLTEVVLPSSVETIGENAFSGCSRLEKISLPEGLREIGEGAFDGCVKLFEKAKHYDGFYVLDGWAVDPWGVGVLEHGVIGGKLVLPEGVRGVAAQTFKKRQSPKFATNETWTASVIASVSLPKSLRHIGEYAFCGIDVASIELHEGVCSVGEQAFTGCTNLLSISVPSTIESWDKWARTFWGCSKLKTLQLSEGLRTLPWDGFRGCRGIESVSIPASVTNGLTAAFLGCPSLLSLEVSPGNQAYKSIEGVVYTKDGKKLVCCPQSKKNVDIPDGVEDIGSLAFNGCSLVETLDIPQTVTNIGSCAFYACSSLRSIRIPSSVQELKQGTFSSCSSLKSVQLPSATKSVAPELFKFSGLTNIAIPSDVTNIGHSAFYACTNLTSVVLPSSVRGIEGDAFWFCNSMASVVVPEGVERIGDFAFGNCRRLMEIRMPSTVREVGRLAREGDCVPERILTSPGDADRIYELVRKDGRPSLRSSGQEDRFVVDGDALVRATSREKRSGTSRKTLSWQRWRDPETGIAWLYSVQGDDAVDVRTEFLEGYKGHLDVPAQLGGKQVSGLLGLYGGRDVTSLSLPMGVTNINPKAFESCTKLESVKMNVDGELKTIGIEELRKQWGLSGAKKTALHNLRKGGSLRARRLQRQQQDAAAAAERKAAREAEQEKAQCEAERAEQRAQLLAIQEELKRVREAKAAAEKQKGK